MFAKLSAGLILVLGISTTSQAHTNCLSIEKNGIAPIGYLRANLSRLKGNLQFNLRNTNLEDLCLDLASIENAARCVSVDPKLDMGRPGVAVQVRSILATTAKLKTLCEEIPAVLVNEIEAVEAASLFLGKLSK